MVGAGPGGDDRRDVNHPSVILWSVGNEIEFQYEERFYELAEAMCRKTRALDPTRPVSLALMPYCLPGFNDRTPIEKRLAATLRLADIVDVLMLNYMESHYRELREAGLRKAVIGSEVYTYYRSCEGQFTQVYPHSPYQDVRDNEYVAGSFIWAGIDYFGEAATGWPCRGWTGSVLDSAAFRQASLLVCGKPVEGGAGAEAGGFHGGGALGYGQCLVGLSADAAPLELYAAGQAHACGRDDQLRRGAAVCER